MGLTDGKKNKQISQEQKRRMCIVCLPLTAVIMHVLRISLFNVIVKSTRLSCMNLKEKKKEERLRRGRWGEEFIKDAAVTSQITTPNKQSTAAGTNQI